LSDAPIEVAKIVAAPVTAAEAKAGWVKNFTDRALVRTGEIAEKAGVVPYARQAGSVVRHTAQGAVLGGVLGAADGAFGLDVGGVPADGVAAGIASLGAIALAGSHPRLADELKTIGMQCATVWGFRKARGMVGGDSKSSGSFSVPPPGGRSIGPGKTSMAGDFDDPILRAVNGAKLHGK
jgi:hypothetical protein